MIEIGERPRGISLRGELKLQLAVSTEAKPDSSSLNKLKTQLKVKISNKVGCVFPMVIWFDFRMGQYRDSDLYTAPCGIRTKILVTK